MSNETIPIIEITDPTLQERVDRAIADLKAHYPNKQIRLLDTVDKQLGKRLSSLCRKIGYASRADFCVAYGFEVITTRSGGRPTTVDPEVLIAELESRYRDKPNPSTLKQISEENPDLKGKIKTVTNTAAKHFGKAFSKVLLERGLIVPTPKTRPQKAPTKKEFTREDIDAAVKEYRKVVYALPCEERPSKQTDIKALAPELAPAIIFGMRKDLALKEELRITGVFYSSPTFFWNNGVRKFAFAEINPLVAKLLGTDVLAPGDPESNHLPRYVAGIDLIHTMELREITVCCKTNARYEPGQQVDFTEDIEDVIDWRRKTVHQINLKLPHIYHSHMSWGGDKSKGVINDLPNPLDSIDKDFNDIEESPLYSHISATVKSCVESGCQYYTTVLLRFLMPLKNETIVSLLRGMGIVTDADIQGDLVWRHRLKQAAENASSR